MNREKLKALLALLIGTLIGSTIIPVFIRTGVATMPPVLFTFLRASFTAIFAAILLGPQLKPLIKEAKKTLQPILSLGLFLGSNILLFSIGIPHTTLVVSQLLYAILPFTTGIVGIVLLKEKMPAKKILGAALAAAGIVALIIFSRDNAQRLSLGTWYGNGIILLAVGFYTMYFIFSKKFSRIYSPLVLVATSTLGTAILLLPLALVTVFKTNLSQITPASWLSVIGIGVVSVVFFFLTQYGLKRLSTVTSAIITQLGPIFAAGTGIVLYGERISLILIISLFLVSTGVFFSLQTEQTSFKDKLVYFWEKLKSRI